MHVESAVTGLVAVGDVGLDRHSRNARCLELRDERVEAALARAATTTLAPCSACWRAVASPMPLVAPVMSATVPSSAVMFMPRRPCRRR